MHIFDGQNTTIWSTNSSRIARNPTAQLLDSGNFVVKDADEVTESYLWESFDFPSDTQLPGMKLGRNFKTGRNRYLTARKDVNDPSPGDFTFRVDDIGLPQFVLRQGREKSLLQRLVSYENTIEWTNMYTMQNDKCDDYARCGPNGICKINQTPICECLEGFVPRSEREWPVLNWTDIREIIEEQSEQDIYIRLPASEISNEGADDSIRKSRRAVIIMATSIISGLLALVLACWFMVCKYRRKKKESQLNREDLELPLFDSVTIASATNSFSDSNKIGTGGFGLVYKVIARDNISFNGYI
ncbi:hypothetical protein V6N11_052394 [Hibiscus sabdariffa]|uniref:Bulb-type lectin domain-containing protein n=1 Tax=Hibiscus sabdariffa TaxID=183260 RepID=A0ABR2UAL9_9ROSI